MERDKRKKKYMVGFSGENQTAYGTNKERSMSQWADPMTLTQARKKVTELSRCRKVKRVIYELVPVETID